MGHAQSICECAHGDGENFLRVMGIDHGMADRVEYRQVGDAVPPLLARAIVAEVAAVSTAADASEVAA